MKKLVLGAALAAVLMSSHAFADHFSLTIGTPPPPPIVEVVPASPPPEHIGHVWHKGYWAWIDEQHVWVPGHWVRPPHPGARWVEPRWEQGPGGYHFHEGYWE